MKKILALAFFVKIIITCEAQTVQWADKVLGFSSQLTPIQYSAEQALGKPSVLPAGGQNPGAWTPDRPNRKEFLKLGFSNPINIQQVAVAESQNPGALERVLLYDEKGSEYEIYSFKPEAKPMKSRMLNIVIDMTPYKVAAVKLEFDGSAVPDYYAIDAVAISDSNYPVLAFVPTPDLLSDNVIVEALDENVNSAYAEINPLLSPDGKKMYFSRRNHPQNAGGEKDKEDIWYSELGADGKWQLAKNMGAPFNNNYPNFVNSISISGSEDNPVMLLGNRYESNNRMSAGVSRSTYENGKWSDPVPLIITNDYNLSDRANYHLSASGKILMMAVQRRDSEGDRDLYVSFQQENNQWTEPVNLGKTINTVGDESAPFLMEDDRTLYFSSNGFSGFGGADIYVTERLDDTWTKWSEPRNLGNRINSSQDDLFFNIPKTSEFAYFSRQVSADNYNIYRVGLPLYKEPEVWVTVTGKLIDSESGSPVGAKIIAELMSNGQKVAEADASAETGAYSIRLKGGENYSIRAEAKDHISESQQMDLRNTSKSKVSDQQDFLLRPIRVAVIEADASIRMNLIFFDFDKSDIKPDSYAELNRFVDLLLNERPQMQVEIAGHTDNIGSNAYNLGLSRRRAMSVKAYMVSKGVDEKRIKAVGYGEARPIASNDDEKGGRELNRRVEFRIISQ